jgi:Zn-dependent M16 (insulinase) family peptidase
MMLPLDILAYHIGQPEYSKHTKSSGGVPNIGTFSEIFTVLDGLAMEPLSYWQTLLKSIMCDAVSVEVLCTPDKTMATELAKKEVDEIAERVDLYGEHGLKKLGEKVAKAVKDNEVNLTKDVLESMPPVPDSSSAPKLLSETKHTMLTTASGIPMPFANVQTVYTETMFAHVRVFFNIDGYVLLFSLNIKIASSPSTVSCLVPGTII